MSKKKWWFETSEEADDIEYAACLFCGSQDYDFSDGDIHEIRFKMNGNDVAIMRYIPTTCDQCCHGFTDLKIKPAMPIH
jgi:hypothetical protein